jgi:hypothetical protein
MSHVNQIMGCVLGKLTVNEWSCFRLHTSVEPPLNVPFQWPQVNTLSANSLHLRFLALYCPNALPLNRGFRSHQICTCLNFMVCSWYVLRLCNIKNNFSKSNPSCTHGRNFCVHWSNTSDACAFMWPVLHLEGCITYSYFWKSFLTKWMNEWMYEG